MRCKDSDGCIGMRQSPNYIHFRNQWQVLGLDAGLLGDRAAFEDLRNKLNKSPVDVDFCDSSYRPQRWEMGKVCEGICEGGQAFTKLVCDPNQITPVEEWTESSAEEFKEKSVAMLQVWFEQFPRTAIIVQRTCIRALLQSTQIRDSREFLGNRIMTVGQPMQGIFQPMPFKIGFTFSCLRPSEDSQLVIDTTVNSWRDNKQVWIQVEGMAPMPRPMNATNPDVASRPFEDCRRFLEEEVIGFLDRYDKKADSNSAGLEE